MQKVFNGMQGCLDAGALGWLPRLRAGYKKPFGEQKDGKNSARRILTK